MPQYIKDLEQAILDSDVIDGEDIHHEFVTGMHGRKIDMDKILTASPLYEQWVDVLVQYISENYDTQPNAIIGVANGANRLAVSVAAKLENRPFGLMTDKETPKSVRFSTSAADVISSYKPDFALFLEDVGTSGTTSLTGVEKALALGAQRAEVLNTWQRNKKLAKLEEAGVPYQSVIFEPLPSFPPDDCDYCKAGVEFVPHD